ncbi:MAG: mechanosensitive ion channel family protein [Desemzia incerta]|uniref:Small conductance mechanosensitive channel n=1 Tax=Desemzia incerta TaxID=82801 RepID=A0A1I5W4W1_9LACT|nr:MULTISPECIES: mechanosensitive ion channel family protein [Desemzia]MCI3029242.1 mechanosensitive ion channel family protein [Desemzia sp. C1]WHZ31243.1 mechanosensitive ion channel family protein [Desemzia incerta]SFQ14794.1 small conductance mechanosensitive channel [Desemzia incerta]
MNESNVTESVVNDVVEKTNLFSRYWNSINWNEIISTILTTSLQILFFLILFYILKKIGNVLITKAFSSYRRKENISINRLNTLNSLSQNIFHAVIGFLLAYSILNVIGVPVASLLTGAGVIGLALSLGAQGFVSDIVNGFFLLLEKQMDVGDVVELDTVSGTVVDVNLKTTLVKSFDGTLNFVPNRYITIVSNKSREDMQVMIKIRLYPDADIQKVSKVISEVNERLVPQFPEITEEPSYTGMIDIGEGQTGIRITMYTLNGQQFDIQHRFFQEYVSSLTEAGIKIPLTKYPIV